MFCFGIFKMKQILPLEYNVNPTFFLYISTMVPQQSPGYDDPDLSLCEAAGARGDRCSQGPVVHQKGAWMKTEKEEEEEEGEEKATVRATQLAGTENKKTKIREMRC